MKVDISHHIDADESAGNRYEYDLYRFSDGETTFVARVYTDEPTDVHFLRAETGDKHRTFAKDDLKSPLFVGSAGYLRALGKRRLHWLGGRAEGYITVDI